MNQTELRESPVSSLLSWLEAVAMCTVVAWLFCTSLVFGADDDFVRDEESRV